MSKLFQKLALVQSQLKSIPESGRNTFHNYKYATAENIINAVRPICSEHGLFISVSCSSHQILKDGKAASVMVTLTVTDSETGESASCVMPGYAEDAKSDKSLWKAMTGATKYAIRSFFCLASCDDPENEEEGDRVSNKPTTINRLQPNQREAPPNRTTKSDGSPLTTLEETTRQMERVGWTTAMGRQFLEQNFRVSTRKHLTPAQLQQFLNYLRSLPSAPAREPVPT